MPSEKIVSARETTVSLVTNRIGAEARAPVLVSEGRQFVYPYNRRDHLIDEAVTRRWRALVVENEYLRATVLPELGGRLFALTDKVSGQEVFNSPRRFRFGRIHTRGAWAPVGVELNFPKGHTVASTVPVTCLLHRHADGGASVVSGSVDRVTGMHWEVWFTLRPGVGRLVVHNRFANPTPVPHGAMYWHNASVPVSDGFRFQSRARLAYVLGEIGPFPWREGTDYSWYVNRRRSDDLFLVDVPEDWFGYYNHDREFGALHVADRTVMPGKKFFSWGAAPDGRMWSRTFGLEGHHYGELQAGLLETQSQKLRFDPGRILECDECWYPIAGLGDVLQATERVAVGFRPAADGRPPLLTVVVTEPCGVLTVTCTDRATGRTLTESSVEPAPLQVETLPLAAAPGADGVDLRVTGRDETPLLDREVGPFAEPTEEEIESARRRIHPKHDDTAEGLLAKAVEAHNWQRFGRARTLAKRALEADAGLAAAHRELGWLALHRFDPAAARRHFEAALRGDPADAFSSLALGETLLMQGTRAPAREHLWAAAEGEATRTPGILALARLLCDAEAFDEAIEHLEGLLARQPNVTDAWLLLAVLQRHAGHIGPSRDALRAAVERNPTHPLALLIPCLHAEKGPARDNLWNRARKACAADPEMVIEAATDLARSRQFLTLGLFPLHLMRGDGAYAASPMGDYVLAHGLHRHGEEFLAAEHLQWASEQPPEGANPSRPAEVRALRWAVGERPDDAHAHLYLGNAYAGRGREEDALREWRRAVDLAPDCGIAHRNIGFTLYRHLDDLPAAWAHYEVALVRYPDEVHFYVEAARLLALLARMDERVALLERAPADLKRTDKWIMAYAVAIQDADRPADAIAAMSGPDLIPWEGERRMRQCWVECHLALGRRALADGRLDTAERHFNETLRYPPNLLHGEPYHTERSVGLYHLALAAEARGDTETARAHHTMAANEAHSEKRRFRVPEAYYYSALSAQWLGRDADAGTMLERTADAWERLKDRRVGPLEESFGFDPYRRPYGVGLACKALGRFDDAERAFLRAKRLYGPQAELMWHLKALRLFGLDAIDTLREAGS